MLENRALLYPLGFLANFLFSFRVLDQWLASEKKKESLVTVRFWKISFTGNALMALHALIQLHYPVCLIQFFNCLISWRNITLMRAQPSSRSLLFLFLSIGVLFITVLFWAQVGFHFSEWVRSPSLPWSQKTGLPVGWFLHAVGFLGIALFASRFWIQWWIAERQGKSLLSPLFWWISLIGSLLSIFYFWHLGDLVNLISYSTGLIPYLRNIMLGRKSSVPQSQTSAREEKVFLFAGEQSGDLLGGGLLQALKQLRPDLQCEGVGGEKMRSQGLSCQIPAEQFQVMGISAVIKAFPRIFRLFYRIRRKILAEQHAAVVLIDYPDFTMRLERSLRKKGYKGKLIHYVSPSVWAWRSSRIKTLSKHLDLLLTILPFEKACYSHTSLSVDFVGHPLIGLIEKHVYQTNWKTSYSLPEKTPLLSLFPGSRAHEIESNLPSQIEGAAQFLLKNPHFCVAISVARTDLEPLIDTLSKNAPFSFVKVPAPLRYELMRESSCAIATSGTVTLELALHQVPTIVTYRLGKFNYVMGRFIFNIRLTHFCLVNLIAKKTLFPEFIDLKLSPPALAETLDRLYQDREQIREECLALYHQLKGEDANQKAAYSVLNLLESTR